MLLSSLLDSRSIIHLDKAEDREGVYRRLVSLICKYHRLPLGEEELFKQVMDREYQTPTAYKSGVAIPHVRLEGFEDTVVGMAFLEEPLDFDGTPISWICLIFSDKSSSNLYLNLVAALLKISKDEALMQQLIGADSGSQVMSIFKKNEIRLKQDVVVADIMVKEAMTITPDTLLSHLGDLLCRTNHSCVPVVDGNGYFLGEVNILNFLKTGVPDYLMMLDNLSFLRTYEPLEKLFELEDKLMVKDIMKKEIQTLKPDTSIPEAVFEMIQQKKRFFSVVDEEGKLAGVLTAMDIFVRIVKGIVR